MNVIFLLFGGPCTANPETHALPSFSSLVLYWVNVRCELLQVTLCRQVAPRSKTAARKSKHIQEQLHSKLAGTRPRRGRRVRRPRDRHGQIIVEFPPLAARYVVDVHESGEGEAILADGGVVRAASDWQPKSPGCQ